MKRDLLLPCVLLVSGFCMLLTPVIADEYCDTGEGGEECPDEDDDDEYGGYNGRGSGAMSLYLPGGVIGDSYDRDEMSEFLGLMDPTIRPRDLPAGSLQVALHQSMNEMDPNKTVLVLRHSFSHGPGHASTTVLTSVIGEYNPNDADAADDGYVYHSSSFSNVIELYEQYPEYNTLKAVFWVNLNNALALERLPVDDYFELLDAYYRQQTAQRPIAFRSVLKHMAESLLVQSYSDKVQSTPYGAAGDFRKWICDSIKGAVKGACDNIKECIFRKGKKKKACEPENTPIDDDDADIIDDEDDIIVDDDDEDDIIDDEEPIDDEDDDGCLPAIRGPDETLDAGAEIHTDPESGQKYATGKCDDGIPYIHFFDQ